MPFVSCWPILSCYTVQPFHYTVYFTVLKSPCDLGMDNISSEVDVYILQHGWCFSSTMIRLNQDMASGD